MVFTPFLFLNPWERAEPRESVVNDSEDRVAEGTEEKFLRRRAEGVDASQVDGVDLWRVRVECSCKPYRA